LYFEWKKTLAHLTDEHHYIRNEQFYPDPTSSRKSISKKESLRTEPASRGRKFEVSRAVSIHSFWASWTGHLDWTVGAWAALNIRLVALSDVRPVFLERGWVVYGRSIACENGHACHARVVPAWPSSVLFFTNTHITGCKPYFTYLSPCSNSLCSTTVWKTFVLQDWDTVPTATYVRRRLDAIIGEISNKVDGLIDNGQIDESASEQCMSTDTYLDFMTDIERRHQARRGILLYKRLDTVTLAPLLL
jgi:hypothetical protein